MAAAIKKEYGLESEFVGGHGGVFEVRLDGALVFTNAGRDCGIPEEEEVLSALRGTLG